MNLDFVENSNFKREGVICYQSRKWVEQGIVHGFLGVGSEKIDFDNLLKTNYSKFFLKQVHGSNIFVFNDLNRKDRLNSDNFQDRPEADAIVIMPTKEKINLLFAIKTADCIPLLIKSNNLYALVHAGWKGLANKITSSVLKGYFSECLDNLEILIGPSAGSSSYEVEMPVIMAIGSTAVYTKSSELKYKLDLAGTIINEIKLISPRAIISNINICTISDLRFNSYRRDAINSGRNYSFIAL
jgi:YfiH family protein